MRRPTGSVCYCAGATGTSTWLRDSTGHMPRKKAAAPKEASPHKPDLVIITGLSGSGKGSVLKSLEDLGFYSVDNLPVELIPKFAELTRDNPSIPAAALG